MPSTWSDKRERQYQHVFESEIERGKSKDKAEEIAARTVNKQRFQSGESENKYSQGTGNPNVRFEERTKVELYNLAKKYNVNGRSKMNKKELIGALRKIQ